MTRLVCGRLLVAPLAFLLAGCAWQRPVPPEPALQFARECAPPPVSVLPSPPGETPESGPLDAFSPRFQRIAAAIGLLPLLRESVALEREVAAKKEGAEVELVRVRQQIVARTLLATLEATSLAAVVRCEQARADELADGLAEKQANDRQLATVVSVIIESATMVATGGLIIAGHEVSEGIAALVGGTIASVLAGVSFLGPARHDFQHPSNLLKEIWENPRQAQYFPGPVWRFLTEQIDGGKSLREQLVESWTELSRIKGLDEEQRRRRFGLLFGAGGTYTIDDLRARAAMLEMLAAAIDLMHDELEVLVREILVRGEQKK